MRVEKARRQRDKNRTLTDTERMLGRTRSACEEGDAVATGKGLMIATYNRPGQHMEERKGSIPGGGLGNGCDLRSVPNEALKCVLELVKEQQIDIHVATETRTKQPEWEAMKGVWAREGYAIGGTWGTVKDEQHSKHTVGGVTVIWNTARIGGGGREPEVRVILPGRIVRVELQVDVGKKACIYGVYMPHAGTEPKEVGEAWDALDKALGEEKGEHIWVVSDLNAAIGEDQKGGADARLKEMLKKISTRNARARDSHVPKQKGDRPYNSGTTRNPHVRKCRSHARHTGGEGPPYSAYYHAHNGGRRRQGGAETHRAGHQRLG